MVPPAPSFCLVSRPLNCFVVYVKSQRPCSDFNVNLSWQDLWAVGGLCLWYEVCELFGVCGQCEGSLRHFGVPGRQISKMFIGVCGTCYRFMNWLSIYLIMWVLQVLCAMSYDVTFLSHVGYVSSVEVLFCLTAHTLWYWRGKVKTLHTSWLFLPL